MKELQGEQVELGFYFGHMGRADALSQVVKFCLEHGGSLEGHVVQRTGPAVRSQRFTHLWAQPAHEVAVNADELEEMLNDADTDVIQIPVYSAIGISGDTPEIVNYSAISPDATQVDNPAIAILGEGWVFSTPGYERQAKQPYCTHFLKPDTSYLAPFAL